MARLWCLVALLLVPTLFGCQSKPASPMQQQMRELNRLWEDLQANHTRGVATQMAGLLESDVITQSDLAANDDFRNWNQKAIEGLKAVELHIAEGAGFDIAISMKQVQDSCGNCHRRYWQR